MNFEPRQHDALKKIMDFDHPVKVDANGVVTDGLSAIYAPEVYIIADFEAHVSDGWELLNGFSGQYLYHGPVMHPSEFIGGRMADEILSTPGIYVAVVVKDMDNATEQETPDAGWAVARLVTV